MSTLFPKITFSISFFSFDFIDNLKNIHCENPYILFIEGIADASNNILESLRNFYTRGLSSIMFLEHYHFSVSIKESELKNGISLIKNECKIIRFFKHFISKGIAQDIEDIINNLTISNFEESFEDIYRAFSSVEYHRRVIGIKSKATSFQSIVDRKLEMINKLISENEPLKVLEEYCDIFIQTISENFVVNTSLGIILPSSNTIFPIIVYDMLKDDFYETSFLIPKIESREIALENPYTFLSRLFVREIEEDDVKSFINECLRHMDRYFQVASKSCIEGL